MDLAETLAAPDVQQALNVLPVDKRLAYLWRARWMQQAHAHQDLPTGDWWSIWLMLAGRGAGKTRTAAEQVGWWAWEQPGSRWLVAAPTSSDVRATCFEGDSGLMSVIPAALVAGYNKALHELRLTNGSLIKGIPASEPERFRGPQFHGAWLDELAAWDYIQEAWDQIQFGVRLGAQTRTVITTTPKPKDLIVELLGREGDDVVVTRTSSGRSCSTRVRRWAARRSTRRSSTRRRAASSSGRASACGLLSGRSRSSSMCCRATTARRRRRRTTTRRRRAPGGSSSPRTAR